MSRRVTFVLGFLSGTVALLVAVAGWVAFVALGYRQHQSGERRQAVVDNPPLRSVS